MSATLSRRDFALCLGGSAALFSGAVVDAVLNRGISNPAVIADACQRLSNLPNVVGAWNSVPETLDEHEQRVAEINGYFRRTFRHAESGRASTLTILCGAGGPMSVHPPTACFEGVGYEIVAGPTVVGLTDTSNVTVTLNKATFRLRNSPMSEVIRVFWGWSVDGQWDAPANPRLSYRGIPALYKLYAVDRAWESAEELAQTEQFLRDALPVVRSALDRNT